mgnify:CR=1 FL=1
MRCRMDVTKIVLPVLLAWVGSIGFLSAQSFVKMNYDTKTVAAMAGEYAAAATAERYYDEQVKDILGKYGVAEVAVAGIFSSKFLDRKAMTDIGLWDSPTENYYYRRIYNLTASKIIPKLWNVSGRLLKYPHKALYWGSYLTKTCAEVKALCMQFESVVTNGTLSFGDINFLELSPRLAAIMQFSQFGNADWEGLINDVVSVPGNFTKENLTADIGTLYELGTKLATSGFDNLKLDILGSSSFGGTFKDNALAVAELVGNVNDVYRHCDGTVKGLFNQYLGNNPTAADIFDFSSYNMTGWIDDYLNETKGTYYTQRWYIGRVESGSETVAEYHPPEDDNSVISGPEWTRFATEDAAFWPDASQQEQALANSEHYAGWSRKRIEELNAQHNGYTYSMQKSMKAYKISKGGRQTHKAYAYSITVRRSWRISEEVYEEYFDSYTMDLATFKMKMQSLLNEYNDNEEGKVYQLKSDAKQYYQMADDAKLKGSESVIVSMTCTDDVNLGEGATQYKCRGCGGSLDEHSKACAMQTTASGDDSLDLSELDEKEKEYRSHLSSLQSERDAMETERKRLEGLLAGAGEEQAAQYRTEIEKLDRQISQKDKEMEAVRQDIQELEQARSEAESDNAPEADAYYRIPAIMNECKAAYNLTWQGEGWWSGYTYYRTATAPNIKGTVTFSASLSIARQPKYFLGIKIHRAILKITWKMGTTYSDTQVVENIALGSELSDAEKKKLVNDKLAELARDYPDCRTSVEYVRTDDFEEDTTEDTYHLLWASDRLAIARQVEARLMNIYADLVSLDKMLDYKMSILDVFRDILPHVPGDEGRKLTIAEKCRKRWLKSAAEQMHSSHYGGKYDETEE